MLNNCILLIFACLISIVTAIIVYKKLSDWKAVEKIRDTQKTLIESTKGSLVTLMVPEGNLGVFSLHDPNDTAAIPYAWAMVTGFENEPKTCILWDIYVRKPFRRRGHAKELIHVVQSKFNRIMTQYERYLINDEGVRLCLSCGFKLKSQMFKNVPGELVWEKGK